MRQSEVDGFLAQLVDDKLIDLLPRRHDRDDD